LNKPAIVFHIPHSSTSFPSREGFVCLDLIPGEVEKLTDWHTDRIFAVPGITTLRAGFSRVFCDVERFVPDELEPMAAHAAWGSTTPIPTTACSCAKNLCTSSA
jgi:N-formylglutamate amidohydrolase